MTIASDNGIVHGKRYRVTASDDSRRVGIEVVLDEDDNSHIPYFKVVSPGHESDARICLSVTGCDDKLEVVEDEDTPDITFHIERKRDSTLIELNRGLSFDQIQRIMAIMKESL